MELLGKTALVHLSIIIIIIIIVIIIVIIIIKKLSLVH